MNEFVTVLKKIITIAKELMLLYIISNIYICYIIYITNWFANNYFGILKYN
jgi:hypothetical protein